MQIDEIYAFIRKALKEGKSPEVIREEVESAIRHWRTQREPICQ
jgi:hypothetical protein